MSVRLRIKVLRLRQLSSATGRFYDRRDRVEQRLQVDLVRLGQKRSDPVPGTNELALRSDELPFLRPIAGGREVPERRDELVVAEAAGTLQSPGGCKELAVQEVPLRGPQGGPESGLGRTPVLVVGHGIESRV